MNTYPSYKDSGVEWIGEIPSEWDVKRLDHFFTQRKDKVDDIMYPPLSVTMKGIKNQLEGVAKSDDNSNRKLVLKNDFVINSRSDRRGSSGISFRDGSVSLINTVLEPKNINTNYVEYLLKSHYFIEEYFRFGKGIHFDLWSTNYSLMKNIKIPVLSEEEQQQISDYLDYKTSKIDTLLEKTQQKIELLKEQRTSLINTTVTKGLNRNVEMKDSGVEWIGEIPSGWSIKKLKYIGNLYGGLTGKSGKDFNNEGNPYNKPFIPFTNIFNNVYISDKHFQYVNVEPDERQNKVRENDLFFLMSSEGYDDLGKSSILINEVDELYLNSFCKGFRVEDNNTNPLFINYQLLGNTHRKLISIEGKGFTRINLRQDKLNNTYMFIPPLQEQQQIVDYLDLETSKIDKLVDIESKRIDLLKEYRQSLISDVVTGKVDVRNEVLV